MARRYKLNKCISCSYSTGWIILASILSSLGISGFIVSMYATNSYISRHRYCIQANNNMMPNGLSGNPNGYIGSQIVFDASKEEVNYDIHLTSDDIFILEAPLSGFILCGNIGEIFLNDR